MPKQNRAGRIWEIDAFRGLCLIGMMVIHLIYDLVDLYGLIPWTFPPAYYVFKNNFGLLFLVISGVSVTLGRNCIQRGIQVFCCGFLCTAATAGMYFLGLAGRDIIIYFGVLQCLGVCMLLWPLFRPLPSWALGVLGAGMVAVGLHLRGAVFSFPWLIPLGFTPRWFVSSDFFPLLPNFGYFLIGAVIGRTVYAGRTSRFPGVDAGRQPLKLLCFCGEHSLIIYLLHQPVLYAAVSLLAAVL